MDPEYIQDIADAAIFGTPVAFASKYPSIAHYGQVLEDERRLLNLIYKIMQKQTDSSEGMDLNELIIGSGFEQESHQAIAQVIKNMYGVYKKELIKRQICQGSNSICSFNWRLKSILGCSDFTHKTKMVLEVEFSLGEKAEDEEKEVIPLELGIHEARELLMRLKKIRRDLKEGIF